MSNDGSDVSLTMTEQSMDQDRQQYLSQKQKKSSSGSSGFSPSAFQEKRAALAPSKFCQVQDLDDEYSEEQKSFNMFDG